MPWLPSLRTRAEGEEWIDHPDTAPDDLRQNLHEQAWLNRWFGGEWAICRHALPFLAGCSSDPAMVLEIGCGGADLSRRLVDEARRNSKSVRVIALDLNPSVLACAQEWCRAYPEIGFVHANALALPFGGSEFDLVLLPDFLHHLPPGAVVPMLQTARRLCRGMVIVADLVRSPLAFTGFQYLARLASLGAMSRNDGALSIRRAFTPQELSAYARQAGLENWYLYRLPFFRMSLVYPGT